MKKFILAVLFVIIISGLSVWYFGAFQKNRSEIEPQVMTQKITLTTSDGKTIIGDYSGQPGQPAILMLHMMPATRASWRDFSEKLNSAGFQTLAVDLRGHGDSADGPSGYKKFSDEEHQDSIHDIEAAIAYLKSINPSKIFVVGASIGANLALWYASEHQEIRSIILLSPGLDYRGIKTEIYAGNLHSGQAVYYVASRDDTYSTDSVQMLSRKTSSGARTETRIFEKAGHGTTIFEREPGFMDELVEWLKDMSK